MRTDTMDQAQIVFGVEMDFARVLEAVSLMECRCNRRLRIKTKKVATLLAKVAEVRKSVAKKAAEAAQVKGDLS